jgi:hypothetical protein
MRCRALNAHVALAAVLSGAVLPLTPVQAPQAQPEFTLSLPAEAIRTLGAALVGRWKTREKYEPFAAAGTLGFTSEGDIVWRRGPGGLTLLEDYQVKTPIGDLVGFGVIWWDQTRSQLQHLFCANPAIDPAGCRLFPTPPLPGPSWNGKELVIDNEVELAGRKFFWREVMAMTSSTTFQQTIDIGESRDRMARWLTSQATKVGEVN